MPGRLEAQYLPAEATTTVEASAAMKAAASVDADASTVGASRTVDPAATIPIDPAAAVAVDRPPAIVGWAAIVSAVDVPPAPAVRTTVEADAAAAGRLSYADTDPSLLH